MSVIGKPLLTGIKLGSSSGPIAYWTRGVAAPLRSLLVNIDPVQDLHGYDNPWAAGWGTNLFDCPTTASTSNTGTLTPNGDGSVTIEATAGNVASLWYAILPRTIPAGTNVTISLNNSDTNSDILVRLVKLVPGESGTQSWGTGCYADSVNKVLTVNQNFDSHAINIAIKTVHSAVSPITLKIQVEIGNSATAWTPYSNVCPVTGWTGCNISQTETNIYDIAGTIESLGAITIINKNSFNIVGGTSSNYPSTKQFLTSYSLVSGKSYAVRAYAQVSSGKAMIAIRDTSNIIRVSSGFGGTPVSGWLNMFFTYDPSVHDYLSFFSNYAATGGNVTYTDIQFCEVTTIPIIWQTEAGTVYGATLDVLTGKLRVTMASVVITEASSVYTQAALPIWICTANINHMKQNSNVIGDIIGPRAWLPGHFWSSITSYIGIIPFDTTMTTLNQANDWLQQHPVQAVYELATPIEYTISPAQISSIVGDNNLWSDTGDIIAEYIQRSLQFVS